MSGAKPITTLFREHKTLLIVITIGIVLLEVEIFAFAAMKTGRKSSLHIFDQQGTLIHVTDGDNLSTFNKYYFENTFGPLDQYQVRLVTKDLPFPFRAWFTAAVGIPIGAVLLFGFIIRAYLSVIHGEALANVPGKPQTDETAPQTRLEKIISKASRLNIFIIGLLVFLLVIAFWIVPNVIAYLSKASLDTMIRYKWIFLPAVAVFVGMVIWIIYLRYLLAKKSIETQAEINKYRLEIELAPNDRQSLALDYRPTHDVSSPVTGLTREKAGNTKNENEPNGLNHDQNT